MLAVMCLYKSSVGVKAVGGRDDTELGAAHDGDTQHGQEGSAGLLEWSLDAAASSLAVGITCRSPQL